MSAVATVERRMTLGDNAWMARAQCRIENLPPEMFYFEDRYPQASTAYADACRRAQAVCVRCVVRSPCVHYALDTGQQGGVWGGELLTQRNIVKVRRRVRLRDEGVIL